jgi:hypothetical protein
MPSIKTNNLLARISKGDFLAIRLNGLQDGSFCMMLECADGTFIHELVKKKNRIERDISEP